MTDKYRVLMEDKVNGEKFNFAICVEAKNQTGSETLAQYGYTEADGARWEAGNLALQEFPEATLVDIKLVVEPTLGELLQQAIDATAVSELVDRAKGFEKACVAGAML